MSLQTARQRLAKSALLLKKSWLLAAVMRGHKPKGAEAIIPNYNTWSRKDLKQQVTDLEYDLCKALSYFVANPKDVIRPRAIAWLSSRFDEWAKSGFGIFTISTAQEFEQHVAEFRVHKQMDIPPYSELLLQPGTEMAFRHPEYMLARDLAFLCELYCDTEALLKKVDWSKPPAWAGAASENAQALARTSILACFNLLESFVSGLARAHIMTTSKLDVKTESKLLSTQEPLKKRILSIPKMIVGNSLKLDINKPPLADLFGFIKHHRDSFVHCEPGSIDSDRGYNKQLMFHKVSPQLVEQAISATEIVIRQIWQAVHQRPGPQ